MAYMTKIDTQHIFLGRVPEIMTKSKIVGYSR